MSIRDFRQSLPATSDASVAVQFAHYPFQFMEYGGSSCVDTSSSVPHVGIPELRQRPQPGPRQPQHGHHRRERRLAIADNTGHHSPLDGLQTHQVVAAWGNGNAFQDNTADVAGPGYGFSHTPVAGNSVACTNHATGTAKGLSNVACS
jgi:hypothetical protein